jgi:hypothetical protein
MGRPSIPAQEISMHSGFRFRPALFLPACAMALGLPAFAGAAALAPDAVMPRLLAVEYVSKLPPGVSADSEKVYLANMHEPRAKTGAIHLHGGVYSPIDATATNALLGARIGLHMGEPVLFGVQTGWTYHTKSLYGPSGGGPPGLNPRTVLATATANLIPAMAFLQVTLTQKFFLAPYIGIAGGYEWLFLKAKDYQTEAESSLTYSNPAWEWYAGMGLRLTRSTRVDGEAFYHGATLGRDVPGSGGNTLRETVDLDGVGVRVGLNIVY